jgi:DNA-binding ferritin-like protein
MDQVSDMIATQLESLKEALATALGQAREKGDQTTADQLLNALGRAEKIQQGLGRSAE